MCLSISVACRELIDDVRTRLRQWRNSRQGMKMPTKSGLLLSNCLLRHMFKKNSYSVLTRNSITRSYFTPLSIHQLVRSSVRPEHLSLLLLISSFLSLSLSLFVIILHQVSLWPLQLLFTNSRNLQVTTCPLYSTGLYSTSCYSVLLISGHVVLDYFVSC